MYSKLESLRGVAACLVVMFHSMYSVLDGSSRFISNSYLFVDFFFMLSGFVMALAYTDRIRSGMSIGRFILLRLGRIYPLHLFMLLVFVCYISIKAYLYSLGFGSEQNFAKNNFMTFLSNLTLLQSIGLHDYLTWNFPSWSISVEFFTYLFFFVCIKSIDNKKNAAVALLLSVSGYLFICVYVKHNLNITYNAGIVRCISGFYLGVFLFRMMPLLTKIPYNINYAEIASTLLMVFSVSQAHQGIAYQVLVLISFFIALSVFSSTDSGYLGELLNHRWLRCLGLWSYSIYMVHVLVLSITGYIIQHVFHTNPMDINGIPAIAINSLMLTIIVIISRYTYVYVEDKYRKLVKSKMEKYVDITNRSKNERINSRLRM